MRGREPGIDLDRSRIHLQGTLVAMLDTAMKEASPAQVVLVSQNVLARSRPDGRLFLRAQRFHQRLGDALGDFVLNGEDLLQFLVEALRPDVIAICNIDQLSSDTNLVFGLPDTAFEHCRDAELLMDLFPWEVWVLITNKRHSLRPGRPSTCPRIG